MLRLIKGLMTHNHKTRDDQHSQTADQSRLSRLKQPQVWIPVSLFVLIALFLILFKVEYQTSKWEVNARDWTGFGQSYDENALEITEKGTETTGTSKKETTKTTTTTKRLQPAKTLWDWMALLLAPATLAGLGFLFQFSQEKAKRDKEEADKARDADQQREQALQTYFDQLSELLVDKQLKKLLLAKHAVIEKPELLIDVEAALDVVKARTLSLLRMFGEDIPRKASVLSFLADADLLNQLELDLSGIRLEGANLKKVNFSGCNLSSADFSRATLISADLGRADLSDADLSGADLSRADLSDVNLSKANLSKANLSRVNLSHVRFGGCDLRDADLSHSQLTDAQLDDADLSNVKLIDAKLHSAHLNGAKLINADLNFVKLMNADLRSADLNGARLVFANLSGADLRSANFTVANLSGADLRSAKFWSSELTGADLDLAKKSAVANIQSAENWQKAIYDSEIIELLIPPKMSEAQNMVI